MTRTVGKCARAWLAIAVAILLSTSGLMVASSPAAAAAPALMVYNRYGTYCLDQHFSGNSPTTLVRTWPGLCHTVGNQQWRFEYLRAPNAYRVINARYPNWCLSAPNGTNSRVFAEVCSSPVPLKQIWIPALRSSGYNQLRNELSFQCMEQDTVVLTLVYVRTCDWSNVDQEWFWS